MVMIIYLQEQIIMPKHDEEDLKFHLQIAGPS